MDLELKIEPSQKEPKVIIVADQLSDEVRQMMKILSDLSEHGVPLGESPMIAGFHGDVLEILEWQNICRIYASGGKVFAVTEKGEYVLRFRLYELEDRMDRRCFVRISNSEIINLKKVKSFDLSFRGTICVEFKDGSVTYVSRRYVSKI
ncbi:MAG: LytTR family DNA-binding domain-containing protein, partial [Clostridia bacterium]